MLFKLLNKLKRKRKISNEELKKHIKMLEHQDRINEELEKMHYYDYIKQII